MGTVVYVWVLVYYPQYDLDKLIKLHFAWILMGLFAVQGVTGMVPAIFTDVDNKWARCDFTHTDTEMNVNAFLAAQIILSTILPYILPFVCLIYPLIKLSKFMMTIEDGYIRSCTLRTVIVVWTHIALSLPWALHALVMLP